jgi:adenylate cyclase
MLELLFREAGKERVVALRDGVVTLGSDASCDVVLAAEGVGPLHARVSTAGEASRLTDLGSGTGTEVNGASVRVALLKHGDVLRLGRLPLQVRRALHDSIVLGVDQPSAVGGDAIIRRVDDMQRSLERHASDTAGELGEVTRANRILRSLSELGRALITAEPDDVPHRVMNAIFEHTSADRGFLMLLDAQGTLQAHVVRHRDPSDDQRITISRTIAERVMRDRVAILSSDAQADARFIGGKSIDEFHIRSLMCAPLWKGDEVIGIVHVDSPVRVNSFDEGHLELLSALAGYAAVAIEQSRLAARVREERSARERLEHYLSPAVATRILSEGETVAQEVEATIVFADIVGFSRLAERMEPAAVADLLNDYLARLADAILEHDGTVDKFIGDCIMGVFGAPFRQDDHAVRAIHVALEMRRLVARLNETRGAQPIAIRIGINSGRVLTGPIGSAKRREITVIGDAVNIAARIGSTVARAGSIVVGERTAELVRDAFELRDLGAVALRGRDEKVRFYEVAGVRPVPPAT